MKTLILGAVVALSCVSLPAAQVDQDWLRRWQDAQTHRPATLSDHSRIAPASEPGTPLTISGLVVGPDGVTPQADAIVFAYHTDNSGLYSEQPGQTWRLRGWARTDSAGRFEFETIRPGPYPNHRTPAHVHLTIESTAFGRQYGGLQFSDDPLVPAKDRDASLAAGRFADVLTVSHEGRVEHVQLNIKLKPRGDF
jgi:protocatechuate 3,4-dioxygenase beta subunit